MTQLKVIRFVYNFSQEAGRRGLWSVNGPRILQVGYEDEEDPKVMEAYELIGSLVLQLELLIAVYPISELIFVLSIGMFLF